MWLHYLDKHMHPVGWLYAFILLRRSEHDAMADRLIYQSMMHEWWSWWRRAPSCCLCRGVWAWLLLSAACCWRAVPRRVQKFRRRRVQTWFLHFDPLSHCISFYSIQHTGYSSTAAQQSSKFKNSKNTVKRDFLSAKYKNARKIKNWQYCTVMYQQ